MCSLLASRPPCISQYIYIYIVYIYIYIHIDRNKSRCISMFISKQNYTFLKRPLYSDFYIVSILGRWLFRICRSPSATSRMSSCLYTKYFLPCHELMLQFVTLTFENLWQSFRYLKDVILVDSIGRGDGYMSKVYMYVCMCVCVYTCIIPRGASVRDQGESVFLYNKNWTCV